jgi:hypothetical protein
MASVAVDEPRGHARVCASDTARGEHSARTALQTSAAMRLAALPPTSSFRDPYPDYPLTSRLPPTHAVRHHR